MRNPFTTSSPGSSLAGEKPRSTKGDALFYVEEESVPVIEVSIRDFLSKYICIPRDAVVTIRPIRLIRPEQTDL